MITHRSHNQLTLAGIAAAFALLLVALYPVQAAETTPGKIIGARSFEVPSWFKQSFLDIREDAREASAADRHLILFFHLEGCPYCAKMVEENFVGSDYSAFLQRNFDVIDIDVRGDREVAFDHDTTLIEKELARHIGVSGTPTLLFLDQHNKAVMRLNGYRSVDTFEQILYFVAARAYRDMSFSEWQEQRAAPVYAFRDHPSFRTVTDLSNVGETPLALLFEDVTCDACDEFHERILARADTRELLAGFTVVRLDAHSDARIVSADGKATTPREYAATLGMDYRPGMVLFEQGREVIRIDSMLRSYHFKQTLRYVAEGHYRNYSEFREFARADQQRRLERGESIDVWE